MQLIMKELLLFAMTFSSFNKNVTEEQICIQLP